MHYDVIKKIVASGVWAAIVLSGTLPAAAHAREFRHARGMRAAPRTAVRAYHQPRAYHITRVPRAEFHAYRVTRGERRNRVYARIASREYFAPRRRIVRAEPFVRRYRAAPFVQYVRVARRDYRPRYVRFRRVAVFAVRPSWYWRRPQIAYRPVYYARPTTYYAQPATYYVTGSYPNGFTPYVSYNAYNYGSPYDYNSPYGYGAPNGCAISPFGDGNNCNPYGYSGYGAAPYAPQQIQGLVVGKTGTLLMVLGGNGLEPTFVNDAPALQNGAASGPVAIGQIISAYGFYSGNMFEATALM